MLTEKIISKEETEKARELMKIIKSMPMEQQERLFYMAKGAVIMNQSIDQSVGA